MSGKSKSKGEYVVVSRKKLMEWLSLVDKAIKVLERR